MKKAITLFLAVMLVLTSIPAFAYSTTGAGMLSAYYQGDSTSPWQAEVTFEKTFNDTYNVNQMSKPIQYLQRTEKEIRTTAYFTSTPASATDAKLYTVLFAGSDLVAVAVAPVDKTKLMATTTINMGDCIVMSDGKADGTVNYFLRAYVWDGMTPMTQLREISTWSFNVNQITVDDTPYTHNANAAGGVFIDNGMGIIDIDESIIADKTNVNLKISMAASSNRKLIANGQEYSYTSGEGFVLNDVDLTNGLAFTIKADASTAHYYINPKAHVDFTPNNTVLYKDRSNTLCTMPSAGQEVAASQNVYMMDGNQAVFRFNNYDHTSLSDEKKTHIKTTFFNDGSRTYLRLFTDGYYNPTTLGNAGNAQFYLSDTYTGNEDSYNVGSFIFDIKFKTKAVENYASSAANGNTTAFGGTGHNLDIILSGGTSSKPIVRFFANNGSQMSLYGSPSNNSQRFFAGNKITADNWYTIRVYARRLSNGTTSYRYYSHDPVNGYICLGSLDDELMFDWSGNFSSSNDNNWDSDKMSVIKFKFATTDNSQKQWCANDIYIDHIRIYDIDEVPAA